MQVKDIGETRLIELLAQKLDEYGVTSLEPTEIGGVDLRVAIGDDSAAWTALKGDNFFTTDSMVDGVHFQSERKNWMDLGWKSMATVVSDIAAMGAVPACSVITLGLCGDEPLDGLEKLYKGIADVCLKYGGIIVGGEVVHSPIFFVTIAMVGVNSGHSNGKPHRQQILTRNSASVGDKVAVTGNLGCSAGGLRMIQQGLDFDRETKDHLLNALDRPTPRLKEGLLLTRNGVRTATDVSDGLISDVGKLSVASDVHICIDSTSIPVDDFLRRSFANDWLSLALSGGEDYELVFTAPLEIMARIKEVLAVTVIGDVTDGMSGVTVVDLTGRLVSVEQGGGWDHFLNV